MTTFAPRGRLPRTRRRLLKITNVHVNVIASRSRYFITRVCARDEPRTTWWPGYIVFMFIIIIFFFVFIFDSLFASRRNIIRFNSYIRVPHPHPVVTGKMKSFSQRDVHREKEKPIFFPMIKNCYFWVVKNMIYINTYRELVLLEKV